MAAIHRLLCTHCTFGTSELESSSADNAGKVLGYSVRKSSLPDAERGQLRQVFRAVERLLSYGLPKDATAAHKETLSADTAPRRLIFSPNLGGWQVAGQVSYRTFDTSQPPRPGSYFADLIVAKAPDPRSRDPEPAWSPCDVLQLWGVGPDRKTHDDAGWWISSEDELAAAESEGPWKPIAPPAVAAVREPRRPLIDDDAAHRFLAADSMAADPLVPARWWAMPAERRRELVAHMLQATIQGPARGGRETVTIAAEPSVAAVLFYIVCRLLPRRIAAGVSFSTYEPAPERPLTGLVATTFLNEEVPTADLPPELAQRGFACNTFRDVSTYGRCQPPPEQGYARRLVALASANDWVGIDSLLAALDAEGLKATDLDDLIKIDHLVTAYFGGEKPTGLSARRGPQEARFLRERFRSVLETQATTRTEWPSDLVEAAIVCLEGELENLWTASGPVRALLERHLPDGEGLKRLLKPPQGTPTAPQALVVAAVVSATLHGKPPRLPSSFVKYCDKASARRVREAAASMLREVIRSLPEDRLDGLIGGCNSASVTDLLLDVMRSLSPSERVSLHRPLTELMSNAVAQLSGKDLDAAADLLARHGDTAGSISASHPGLQSHLDDFFRTLLDDNAPEAGRHLVDAAGRSRVAGLQRWADHSLDRGRVGQALGHWKSLHDAVTRLAQAAPPWRSWARPNPPEVGELPAAVTAIHELRPFGARATDRQNGLATGVVALFKRAHEKDPDLQARWVTVEHWLKNALDQENNRRFPRSVRPQTTALPLWAYGFVGAVLVAIVGVVALSQGMFDGLLVASRKGGEKKIASASEATDATAPKKPSLGGDPKAATASMGKATATAGLGTAAEPPEPQEASLGSPRQLPPLKEEDVNLKTKIAGGVIEVTWNHDELKDRLSDCKLTLKCPNGRETPNIKPDKDGRATIPTKDCGFGAYEVTLSLRTTEANPRCVDKRNSFTIHKPTTKLKESSLDLSGPKPSLVLKIEIPPNQKEHYGDVAIRLTGPANYSNVTKAVQDGSIRFELPDSVQPETFEAELPQFKVATVVPEGPGDEVNVIAIKAPEPKQEILATLGKQNHIAALAEKPSGKPELICDLPWSLRPDRLDLNLMTPEFKAGTSLRLGPKDTSSKTPRWPCKATVSVENEDQESAEFVIGHFEFEARSAWQPRLQFKPVEAREKGHDAAYAALRCCRLCLVLDSTPIATCQLIGQSSMGPLKINFPVPFMRYSAAIPALNRVPACLARPLLTQSSPEPVKLEKLVLSMETPQTPRFVLSTQDITEKPPTAAIKLTDGEMTIDAVTPALTMRKVDTVDIEKRTRKIEELTNNLSKIKDGPTAERDRRKIRDDLELAQKAKDELEGKKKTTEDWNKFLEAVKAAEFSISDWRIAWETVAPGKVSPPSGTGGTVVVLIQGSRTGEPIVFKAAEKRAPDGKQAADASESPAE